MEKDTKTNINNASLIDLKAELFRKHEEFKQQKNASGSFVKGRSQEKCKPNLFSRKNKGVLERAERDYEEKVEEEDVHAKSRKALEAKAKLYEKIASSSEIPEEDGSGFYLVDFQKKVIDNIVEARDREQQEGRTSLPDNDSGRDDSILEDIPPPSTPQEEWVDYVDSLGRSRRCMKKDLPELMKQDKDMARVRGEVTRPAKVPVIDESAEAPTLMSSDMHRELLRQKWEKEEEEALKNTSIHYANVQFDEIRTHGVGFYQFDKSDEKRQEQMDNLQKLREQTVDERGRRERLKEKRKAMLDARLAKVKQRRKLKDGVSTEDNKDEEQEIGPKLEEMLTGTWNRETLETPKEKEGTKTLTRDDSWRKNAPVREWDKGKEKTLQLSQERYMSERRDERQSEFAPPSTYFVSPPSHNNTQTKTGSTKTFGKSPDAKLNVETSVNECKTVKFEEVDVGSIPLPTDTRPESMDSVEDKKTDSEQLTSSYPLYQNVPVVQLPDFSVPPPGYQPATQWTQHTGAGPPVYPQYPVQHFPPVSQMRSHLPDMSVPPPHVPHVQQEPPSSPVGVTQPASHTSDKLGSSYNPSSSSAPCYEAKPSVYVPRAAVLDTRLVQNVESDIPSASADVPEVRAEPYKPGSFTAAMQAEYQERENIATASRDRAHFKGGPVMYKQEPTENSVQETDILNKQLDNVSHQQKEDELASFLKEIRESV